jgi:hypothetical protein
MFIAIYRSPTDGLKATVTKTEEAAEEWAIKIVEDEFEEVNLTMDDIRRFEEDVYYFAIDILPIHEFGETAEVME